MSTFTNWDLSYGHTMIIKIWIILLGRSIFYHILDLSYCVIQILMQMVVTMIRFSFTSLANIQSNFHVITHQLFMVCAIHVGQTSLLLCCTEQSCQQQSDLN